MRALLLLMLVACGTEAAVQTTELQIPERPRPIVAPVDPRVAPEPPDPEAHRRCREDDQCVVGRDACGGPAGVHRDHADAFEARMAELRPQVDCAYFGARGAWDEPIAFCSAELCQAVARGRRCQSTDDCEIVGGGCGQVASVNHETAQEVREHFAREIATRTCTGVAPPQVPRCVDHACTSHELDDMPAP